MEETKQNSEPGQTTTNRKEQANRHYPSHDTKPQTHLNSNRATNQMEQNPCNQIPGGRHPKDMRKKHPPPGNTNNIP